MIANRRKYFLIHIAAAVIGCLSCQVSASALFNQNTQHISGNLGWSDYLDNDYVDFGMGYRYFPWDGLEVGLDFDLLLGNTPIIYRVSPEIRYVFHGLKTFIPYVGVFYQYNYIVDLENLDGLGARAGLYTPLGDRTYIGYGFSRGQLRRCDTAIYSACSTTTVELNISLVF